MEEQIIQEDKMVDAVIDLSAGRENKLNESWLAMFGFWTKMILRIIFGENVNVPVQIKGSKIEIESFANSLAREKRYMQAISKYGLNDARTYKYRSELDSATRKFERDTGLKWPFK